MDSFEDFLRKLSEGKGFGRKAANPLPSLDQLSIALRQVAADDPSFPDTPEREAYLTRKLFPKHR